MDTAVLGLGNELLGDEGVGVHAVRRLSGESLPEGTRLVEVGTAIIDALPILEQVDNLIIIDAMKADGLPGTVYQSPLQDCLVSSCLASMHGFDITRTMALAGRRDWPQVVVFGVEPKIIDWSLELSAEVRQSLPPLLCAVKAELLRFAASAEKGKERT